MVNLAVIHYSQTGNVYEMAKTAADEAAEAGAEVRLRKVAELAPAEAIASNPDWAAHVEAVADVPEASLDDLEWADAVMWGTPTRFGVPCAQLRQFVDQTGPLWQQGKLANKVMSTFVSTQTSHGGQESTILAMNNTFYHWGAIIVGIGYTDPAVFNLELGNPYGASHIGNAGAVGEHQRLALSIQVGRVLDIAAKLTGE
ncbi:NAD(P)H:quinone oxidoreductase [Glycomyces arizonensis]|uniref:NAD(P)H:quinone oxidoreductase n=1 Tax=Glycomyces arizonensis TaxID=256035 RepID=UPI00041B78A6|nr:NAD(P)H:quinone oxidoreductase [Glycomyces arizonensis]